MSLTNDDLLAISDLLDTKLQPIKEDVSGLKKDVGVLKEDVSVLKEEVSVLKEEVSVLKEDVSVLKEDISKLKKDVRLLQLDNENDIKPKLQVLFDSYVPAARLYEYQSDRINELQSDVDVLKEITKKHSEQLQKLA